MLYGIFADVHSNLEALEVVLALFRSRNVEAYVFCGDMVGYGPDPNVCVEMIASLEPLHAVVGNHDLASTGSLDLSWFNENAKQAAQWTHKELTASSKKFINSLPKKVETPDFMVTHGSPRDPIREYVMSAEQFLDSLKYCNVFPCFIGHSHVPLYFEETKAHTIEGQFFFGNQVVQFDPHLPFMLNPGGVGQPRDFDSRAACALYDTDYRTIEVWRLKYPIIEVQAKMRRAGLPEFLANRLSQGL